MAAKLCITPKVNSKAEMLHHLVIWLIVRATQCGVMHTSERNSFASRIIFWAHDIAS